MMNRRHFLIGLGAGCACSLAGLPAVGREDDFSDGTICGLFGKPSFRAAENVRDPSPETLEAVSQVARALGIALNFDVLEADIERWAGFATIRRRKRYIVLDPQWLNRGWASIGLIGHEIGHHLHGHTVHNKKAAWGRELEADFTAGRAISFLGGSLADAQRKTSERQKGTKTHPPGAMRLQAIEAGWRQAESQKGTGL